MKSKYNLQYVVEDGVYCGSIKELSIFVQSNSKDKMIQDAKDSAKVLFAHLAKKIEFEPIECELVEFLSSPDSIGGKLNIPDNKNESASYTVPENSAPSEVPNFNFGKTLPKEAYDVLDKVLRKREAPVTMKMEDGEVTFSKEETKESILNKICNIAHECLELEDGEIVGYQAHHFEKRIEKVLSDMFTRSQVREEIRKAWEVSEEAANQCTCGECDYCVQIGGPKVTVDDYLNQSGF